VKVVTKAKEAFDRGGRDSVLIFDDTTSELVDVNLRGTAADVLKRLKQATGPRPSDVPEPEGPRGPGRPKLGVVAREVTLLPRHWDWLNSQPGGASVALRKLVEEARRVNRHKDRVRASQDAAYRFMSAMAGNLPGFEEATRALFAGKRERFEAEVEAWPVGVREHARKLAAVALGDGGDDTPPPSGSPGGTA
jgi:hypothetical protein